MITPRSIYAKSEAFLEPREALIDAFLVVMILASLWLLLFARSNTAKAAWVVYMFSP